MRTEARLFTGVAVFLIVVTVVYGLWAREPVGTTALGLSGGLCVICGTYFYFIVRRIQPRPEDRGEAEIAEGAGDLGFFSPASYWPFGIGLACAVTALGMAFLAYWLIAIGAVAIFLTAAGLVFEYYVSPNR